MAEHPAPQHRELTQAEQQQLTTAAFKTETAIKRGIQATGREMWKLAEAIYRFHEGGMWGLLGADTLEEWLADPEVSMTRTQFFRLSKLWRDLYVVRKLPKKTLRTLDPSKAAEVLPALMKGKVSSEDWLSDVQTLGFRDLRIKYSGEKEPEPPEPDGSGPPALEPSPDADLPPSALKDEADAMAGRLIGAIDNNVYIDFTDGWRSLDARQQLDVATAWLEAAANG